MSVRPVLLAPPGPHGVAAYARAVAEDVRTLDPALRLVTPDDLPGLPGGTPVHVHVTDRLWGTSPEEATARLTSLAQRHPLTVTLHDVPQASDGERNRPRRRAFYAAVGRAAHAVAVNSAHERALLVEEDVWHGPVEVVPLPVPAFAEGARPHPDGTVGVLGYFYPGKGHDEALAAAAEAGIGRLTVLGRASDGHAADLEAFVRRAADAGVGVEVTGWLDDAEMAQRARAVSVPVIAHRHVSASGSLASWIGWGRRPIAVRNRYVDEMDVLRPGTLLTVEPSELSAAVRTAADDPDATWHGIRPVPVGPADVARAYLAWWHALPTPTLPTPAPTPPAPAPAPAPASAPAPQVECPRHAVEPHPGAACLGHSTPDGARWVVGNRWDLVAGKEPEPPRVSVIVTHYAQPDELARTLAALARQDHPRDRIEIVVTDDGSPDAPVVPDGVTLVRQADRGFRAAAARNLGVAASTGDILCFLDADTTPEPGYVRALTRLPALLPEAVTVGRRRHADLSGLAPDVPVAVAGPERELPEPGWLREEYARTQNLLHADDRAYRFVIGAVSACSRTLFDEVGGFDETYTSYGGEDWEWVHRAWQSGAVLAHVPEAVAWHDGPDWSGRDIDRAREGNRQTLRLAADIPVAGSAGRGLLPAQPDLVVHLAGEHPEPAVFLCVDALLAAFPRAAVILDAPPTSRALAADPRVRAGIVPDARVICRLDRPVLVDVADDLAPRLAALGQGDEGWLEIRAADGTPVGTASARRARRRAERWGAQVGFETGGIVASGVHVLRDEPHLEAWVGGWGGLDRFV
ncbi:MULTISPECIES: glycosyltransferase [Microbacterium]|uniref:glycosyltransferase n=1 Tax=Microbacterium TaxID=33882 RepID=UPI001D17D096|nr:glycosyltransferase [Microbacterium testaceum]MCC4247449.1 glycosyltransferase [Microbacterium testaceum]